MTQPVLIYGASGGVGSALARRLAAAGRPLHLVARDAAKLEPIAEELNAAMSTGDVTSDADLQRITAEAGEGGLAGLVFAVGSIDLRPLRRATADSFATAFSLNVTAAAMAVRHAAPALTKVGGNVVLFSSVAGAVGFKSHVVIGTAKAAVEGLTRNLAAELAPKVRVNCIAPTLTRTPLAEPIIQSAPMAEAIAKQHALARLGEADDVAAMAALLLSPDSAYVTGQVIAVDGGRSTLAV